VSLVGVSALHHVNLKAPAADLEVLRDFYRDVVGLAPGPRPPFRIPGFWLYADGVPVLHLSEATDAGSVRSITSRASALDHVAFRCSGIRSILARLDARGIDYQVNDVPLTGETQVVFKDPLQLGVELAFDTAAELEHG
jgi:catechol 2,3-dioxygenase-like lactoylglutathione lyase family enzyme